MDTLPPIVFTKTDEAPALATASLLPIIEAFLVHGGVTVKLADISLGARILAQFSDRLAPHQKVADALSDLAALAKDPAANIIKLPNISASLPQLKAAIAELKLAGYGVSDYVDDPKTDAELDIRNRYAKVLGSAVNPVIREGNSDRRVAMAVKEYARQNPHSMGQWSRDSKTHIASMIKGDFFESELSTIMDKDDRLRIEFVDSAGVVSLLKGDVKVQKDDVIDAARLSVHELKTFYASEILQAKETGLLLSLHLKATMMKVSDPVIFGHCLEAYFAPLFAKFDKELAKIGFKSSDGLADLEARLDQLSEAEQKALRDTINECFKTGPALAMVDSAKGITNLHVPSDVIVDASVPAFIRAGGKMWDQRGVMVDTKALIPDRCYARIYQEVIDDCKKNGAYHVATMGTVPNVGLMAQKAEEYGSHDKTFVMKGNGQVRVVGASGAVLFQHEVQKGDIWRMCQTKDAAIRDWVKLAVTRSRISQTPAIFWLDNERSHDQRLREKVLAYLNDHDLKGISIQVLGTVEAMKETLKRMRQGLDTISVTGNVLRDYLTDLFPILELGTSAKMLSIVPLLAGGGLFETGAGGSAPKHVQQFVEEGHLRWDSLGEFLALAVSLEDMAHKYKSTAVAVLAKTLDQANTKFLRENKSPQRSVGELDNRGSHFYWAMYWAEALAQQDDDQRLKKTFSSVHESLVRSEGQILKELSDAQGKPVALGGYYYPNTEKVVAAMRSSRTLNEIIDRLSRR